MNNSQQPAHPIQWEQEYGDYGRKEPIIYTGLTKREYFAAMAMQGLLADTSIDRPHPSKGDLEKQHQEFSRVCLMYADSLLSELEKKEVGHD